MALVFRVGRQDAVGGGVVGSSVHSVAAGFVERCLFRVSPCKRVNHVESLLLTGNRASRAATDVIVTIFGDLCFSYGVPR